jgi:hypothetical protein
MGTTNPQEQSAGADGPADADTATASRWAQRRRRLRRSLWTSLIVLLVLVLVAFLLPIWASTPQGRAYALQHLNRRIHGKLDVGNWRLGWFSGLKLERVRLSSADGWSILECSSVRSDLTLWGCLIGQYDVGTLTLEGPHITLRRFPDGSNDLTRAWYGTPVAGPGDAAGALSGSGAWSLKTLRGSIRVEHGELLLQALDPPEPGMGTDRHPAAPVALPPLHLTEVMAEMPIAAADAPIHLTLQALSHFGSGSSPVDFRGDLPSLATWGKDPGAFLSDVQLTAGQVPVAAVGRWLGIAGHWEEALGPALDEVTFSSHSSTGGAANQSVAVARLRSGGGIAELQFRILVESRGRRAGALDTTNLLLQIPETPDFYAHARMLAQGPVLDYLAYVNPLFLDAAPNAAAQRPAVVEASVARGQLALDQPQTVALSMLLQVTDFRVGRHGLAGQIMSLSGSAATPPGRGAVEPAEGVATIPILHVAIEQGQVQAEQLQIDLPGQPRWTFTGTVGLSGKVNLLLTLPLESLPGEPFGTLGGATLQLPVTGTLPHPTLVGPAPGATTLPALTTLPQRTAP